MLALLYSGKVRDVFDAGGGQLVIVASDRISAFDRVFAEPVPDKGRVLTAMTAFWCAELSDVAPNHLVSADPADLPPESAEIGDLAGRAMLVRRAEMLPIECIVRGYLAGSAWEEYRQSGTVHGEPLPAGLREADALPVPMFTPSTKGGEGEHDVNLSFAEACELVGEELARRARDDLPGGLRARRGTRRRAGHRRRRHQARARCDRRGAGDLRRSAHAGLEPLLAGRGLETRCQPPFVRQAAGARLGRRNRLGQAVAATTAAARGGARRRASATSRPTSC